MWSQDTKDDDYEEALSRPCDFVIIAGGDGTIGKIAKQMIYRQTPIAILPCGNANNIAASLGLDTAVTAIVDRWESQEFKKLTVGRITIDQESEEFLESVGWGLFADVLEQIKTSKKKKKQSVDQKIKIRLNRAWRNCLWPCRSFSLPSTRFSWMAWIIPENICGWR